MFDNPEKLFIILLIALFIFGPQKLIGIGASMGKAVRDFRSHVRDAQDQFHAAVAEAQAEAQKTEEAFTVSEPPALPAPDPIVPDYPGTMEPAQPAEAAVIAQPDPGTPAAAPAPGSSAESVGEDDGRHSLASEPSAQAVLETLQRRT